MSRLIIIDIPNDAELLLVTTIQDSSKQTRVSQKTLDVSNKSYFKVGYEDEDKKDFAEVK